MGRFRVPAQAATVVERSSADTLLRRADRRPLVTLTAGPGWGKTTFAASWARARGYGWYALGDEAGDPRRLAAGLLAAVGLQPGELTEDDPARLADEVIAGWVRHPWAGLVLDDADVLATGCGLGLLDPLLRRLPEGHQLVLASRGDIGLVGERERAAGTVLELDATHLALDTATVAELVALDLDEDPALAARIVDLTGGWPAAVRLLVDALHDVAPAERVRRVSTLIGSAGPVSAYVGGVVLPDEDPWNRRVVAQLSLLGDAAPSRLAKVTGLGLPEAAQVSGQLVARGLAHREPSEAGTAAVTLSPAVRVAMRERYLPEREDHEELIDDVLDGLRAEGAVADVLRVATTVDRPHAVAEALQEHGDDLLNGGSLDVVVDAAAALPPAQRTPLIERLHGQALAFRGEWAAALRCFDAAGIESDGPLAPEDGMGLGLVHHLRGDLDAAIEIYDRVARSDGPAWAQLAAWRSTAHWLRGETESARHFGDAALDTASRLRDDRALALAHTSQALLAASKGDRRANEAHYRLALAAARRAGDVIQQARILTNLGSLHLEQGEYAVALDETEEGIDLADGQGFAMVLAIARCNRSEILLRTGSLDEAIADAEVARGLFARIGSRHESYAHHLLGDARREQGDLVLARQAYERSLRLAAPSGDKQGRVPAYIGLARTLAGTDPDGAWAAARQALDLDDGMTRPEALLVAAWAQLARGDREEARSLAVEAHAEAQRREDRASSAEVETLLAVLDDDPVPGLRRAAALWRQVNARISATRVELGVARRSADPAERSRAIGLEQQLRHWGCSIEGGAYAHRVVIGADARPRIAIRVLGGFAVEQQGRPLPRSAWGSRKARDLLKVLVARGSRGATREELADLLWPDEAYESVANRLSVALSVLRGVLSGEAPSDEPIVVSDGPVVRLDIGQVEVDVERFRRLATDGLAAARRGDRERAVTALASAEQAYTGDLLEEDRDVLWLIDRREELRTAYVSVARTLAGLQEETDPDLGLLLLLRILDRDPYDEPAHLGVCRALIRAGRHGEARRRHRLYTRRMEELDLPAVPFAEVQRGHFGAASAPAIRRAR